MSEEKQKKDINSLKVGDYFFDDDGNKWTVISVPEYKVPEDENDMLSHHVLVIPATPNKEPYAVYALGSNARRTEKEQSDLLNKSVGGYFNSSAIRSIRDDGYNSPTLYPFVGSLDTAFNGSLAYINRYPPLMLPPMFSEQNEKSYQENGEKQEETQ